MSISNNKFSAVTTFNLHKHPYGVEMINSFFANWPDNITLTAYVEESSELDDRAVKPKIIIKDFYTKIFIIIVLKNILLSCELF